jgi:hypothetical protein
MLTFSNRYRQPHNFRVADQPDTIFERYAVDLEEYWKPFDLHS